MNTIFLFGGRTICYCFVLRYYQKSLVKLIKACPKAPLFIAKQGDLKKIWLRTPAEKWLRILIGILQSYSVILGSVQGLSPTQLDNKIGAKFKNDFWLHLTRIWLQTKICTRNLPKYLRVKMRWFRTRRRLPTSAIVHPKTWIEGPWNVSDAMQRFRGCIRDRKFCV